MGSSQRHISRLENGVSRPSEQFIDQVAVELKLGSRDRSHLRISAGYTPTREAVDFNAPEYSWLRKAAKMTLQALEPHPTSVMDSIGNLLMVNRAWVSFYSAVFPGLALGEVVNFYDLIFTQSGVGNKTASWNSARALILMALQQEVLLNESAEKAALLKRLLAHPTVPADWRQQAAALEPMASFGFPVELDGEPLWFYNVSQSIGAVGPAAYISEPNLTVSTLYPQVEGFELAMLAKQGGDAAVSHPLLYTGIR